MWQPLLTVLPVLSLARCGLAARLASFCALRPDILLHRRNVIKSRRAETLEIELFDEPGQRQFPGLRFVVIELAQFRWSNGGRACRAIACGEELANHIAPPGGCLADVIELL